MNRILAAIALSSAQALLAQTLDQSIGTTVTRTLTVPAELAVVEARVAAVPTLTPAQAVQALESIGFREQHLLAVNVSGNATSSPQQFGGQRGDTVFSFQMTAPAEEFASLINRFEVLRQRLPNGVTRLDHNVFLGASQRSIDAARQAALPEMFTELRARAEALAQVAGVRLGPVISINDSGLLGGGPSLFGTAAFSGTRVNYLLNARFARQQ